MPESLPPVLINNAGIADYPKGTSFGPRQLHDYEFVWIERGDCEWVTGSRTVACPPGTVILCQPETTDRFTWDSRQVTRHGFIHFEFLGRLDEFLPLFRRCQGGDVLRPLLRQAVWLAGQGSEWTDELAARALSQALDWYISGFFMHGAQGSPAGQHPVLSRALEALRRQGWTQSRRPPSVAEWASLSQVSRGHLARVCRQELDVSPLELLRLLRLEQGLELLTRSDLKVHAISDLCGFANPYHFSRSCKRAYGFSPREIRERTRVGERRPPSPVPGLRRIWQQFSMTQ